MDRRRYVQLVGAGGALSLSGCLGGTSDSAESEAGGKPLTVATATTTRDSGLLEELVPGFERTFGATVDTVARGTGAALRTARNGNCDVVLVHARPLEDAFIRSGHGVNRRAVMVNDFLLVGPPADPAGIAGAEPAEAVAAIADAEASFLSRGDRSGTHLRERRLWSEAGIDPAGSWYRESGQGMGSTLAMAAQSGSYTLTDRGTFLNVGEGGLAKHVARGIDDPPPLLRNEYAAIPVNPARHDAAYPLAMAFLGYLTGPGQARIAEFRVAGERAFRPIGRSREPRFDQYVPSDWSNAEAG